MDRICIPSIFFSSVFLSLLVYDGSGFDFLSSVIQARHYGLAILLVFYLIFCAMVLLNGLINIFGNFEIKEIHIEHWK